MSYKKRYTMKRILLINMRYMLLVLALYHIGTVQAQRQMEKLDRGLVAVQTGNGVFLSWRVFGTDPKNVAFNIYRNGTKINASPITGATNMTDGSGSGNSNYTVRPVIGGTEQAIGGTAGVWSSQVQTVNLSNRPSNNHAPNDINVGDLDGDGQYELVVKWYPNNAKDNSQGGVTDNTYLAAYKLDGTFLWMIDLGRNIRSGAHYTQHLVADFDSDGKAEVICKTAPNTKDGRGNFLSNGPAANDNDNADYRTTGGWDGFVISGPEYLTIFNGETGREMKTVTFLVGRGVTDSWGKSGDNTNRLDRFNSTIAYLDGKKPSAVFNRGYYSKMTHSAWDWDGTTLSNRWIFNSSDPGNGGAFGQGNHSMMAADIDGDGFDEILTGAACIDHDGKFKWATGHGHGDANHVGDFDLSSPGLEVWNVSENKGSQPDHYMIRARDGHVLWGTGSGNDNGRGMVGDIDANHPGQEAWSNAVSGTYTGNGTRFSNSKGSSNFRVYWDGDLQDELLDGNKLDKWNGNGTSRLLTLTGQSCNGSKATPNLSADILGDWREEVILHDGASRLYIHTTTIPTQHKLYTLMHDPVYRNAISWQQSSYNQPPHLGFFLGAGVDKAPTPNIVLVGADVPDCNGVINGDAYLDDCNTCVGGNTGKIACVLDCNGDENGTASLDECGVCSGGKTGVIACKGVIQGESFCEATGILEDINTGFVGEGYLNFDNQIGSSANWNIIAATAGTYPINIIYANGGNAARAMTISINGNNQGQFAATTTGGWTDWQTETVNLNLNAGVNTLLLTSNSADGGPNLDQLTWSNDNLSAGSCEVDCNGVLGGLAFEDNCNTCVGGNTNKEACEQDCAGEWGGTALTDNCGVCLTGNRKPCVGSLEAEPPCSIDGIELESINAGFSGNGYVNTTNAIGAYVSWELNSNQSQTATVTFQYANGGTTSRDGAITVNGAAAGNLVLPPTGAWTTWGKASVNLNLTEGTNDIIIISTTTDGLANIDLIYYSAGVSNGNCLVTALTTATGESLEVYPNPTSNAVQWGTEKVWGLMNYQGKTLANGKGSELNLADYPAGIYFIRLDTQLVKVVKQ